MSTTLYLVRHAHAHWTPDDARQLSEAGREAATRLAALLGDLPIAAIYSSPSRRAVDTVAPLADRLGHTIEVVADFRERDMTTARLSPEEFERLAAESWRLPNQALAGAESNAAAQRRGSAALLSVLGRNRDQHVVVSTHGTLMALMMNAFSSSFGYEFWSRLTFPDVYQLDFDEGEAIRVARVWTDPA